MTCPGCESHLHTSAAFCTWCGTHLLAEPETREPLSVGIWEPMPTVAPGMTTAPVRGPRPAESSRSVPVNPSPERAVYPPTPVKELVGSALVAWIDSVWGSTAKGER